MHCIKTHYCDAMTCSSQFDIPVMHFGKSASGRILRSPDYCAALVARLVSKTSKTSFARFTAFIQLTNKLNMLTALILYM